MAASKSQEHPGIDFSDADWPQHLVALLESQQSLVRKLATLAERQRELIEERRTDALLGLLQQRQRLVDEFVASQQRFHQLSEGINERIDELEDGQRQHIRELVNTISAHLDTVMQRDQSDQDLLRGTRDEARQQIGSLDRGTQARSAYRQGSPSGNRFADRQG